MKQKVILWRCNKETSFDNEPLVIEVEILFLQKAENRREMNFEFDQGSLRRLAESI
jgi:hypothetical protein